MRQPADRRATDALEVPHDNDAATEGIGDNLLDESVEYPSRTMERPALDI